MFPPSPPGAECRRRPCAQSGHRRSLGQLSGQAEQTCRQTEGETAGELRHFCLPVQAKGEQTYSPNLLTNSRGNCSKITSINPREF